MFSALRTAQTSRSRVTRLEPCNTPAKPPTITKSTPASQRRSISRFSCTTEFTSDSFELQREFQGSLVLLGTLVVGIAQADLNETEVDSSADCFFSGGHRGADCMPCPLVSASGTPYRDRPRALTGHTSCSASPLTTWYASYRFTVGSQWGTARRTVSPIDQTCFCVGSMIRPCSSPMKM